MSFIARSLTVADENSFFRSVWPILYLLNIFTVRKRTHFYIFIGGGGNFFTETFL